LFLAAFFRRHLVIQQAEIPLMLTKAEASLFPTGIGLIDRIIPHIGIEIDLILIAYGIGLQEPAERRRVDARLVVVHAKLGDPRLAGVLEAAEVARLRDAVLVIAVGGDAGAARVADRDDAALLVCVRSCASWPTSAAGSAIGVCISCCAGRA
jgi:hypothetical protein